MKISLSAIAVCAVFGLIAPGCGSSLSPAGSGHENLESLYDVSLSPDEKRMVVRSRPHGITVRDAQTEAIITNLQLERAFACRVIHHPREDVILAGYADGRVVCWKPDGAEYRPQHLFKMEKTISTMRFSPNGQLAAVGDCDGNVVLYSLMSENRILHRFQINRTITELQFSPDGSTLVVAGDSTGIHFRDVKSGMESFPEIRRQKTVRSIAYSPDGSQLAIGDLAGELTLFDVKGNCTIWKYTVSEYGIRQVLFDHTGHRLIVADLLRGEVGFHDARDGKRLQRINAHRSSISGIVLTADGELLTAGHDGRVRRWPANDPERLALIAD